MIKNQGVHSVESRECTLCYILLTFNKANCDFCYKSYNSIDILIEMC